jgi:hypothetical protein
MKPSRSHNRDNADQSRLDYSSHSLGFIIQELGDRPETQALDMGPVCSENIAFFARRINKLFVCDFFLRMDRYLRGAPGTPEPWQDLDYGPNSFDCIFLWDLLDRLDDHDARRLMDLCFILSRVGGLVLVCAFNDQRGERGVDTFVISDGFQITFRPQPHLDLPPRTRQNRDMMDLLVPYSLVKSFIYRNGVLEFLLRRE